MNSSIQTRLYLLRHGEVDGLPALYGHTDIDVSNEVNNKIIKELCLLQKNSGSEHINQIISSPLQRCFKVANEFSKLNALPIEIEDNFTEMNFGEFDGLSFNAIKYSVHGQKAWGALELFWEDPSRHPLPQAESLLHFYQRVKLGLTNLLNKHQGKNILLVCHGGVIRMILSYVLNLDHTNKALFSQLNIINSSITLINSTSTPTTNTKTQKVYTHNQVLTVSTPLSLISQSPKEFK